MSEAKALALEQARESHIELSGEELTGFDYGFEAGWRAALALVSRLGPDDFWLLMEARRQGASDDEMLKFLDDAMR